MTNAEMAEAAKRRPSNYGLLAPEMQWEIDKQLGILDWDGTGHAPLSITEIHANTLELSTAQGWAHTPDVRLKKLAGELMELAQAPIDMLGDECFDVVWNAIDYLRLRNWTAQQIEEAFRNKMHKNRSRTWSKP